MQDIKLVFYTEQELDLFIHALECLRDSDSDGFTQRLIEKHIEVEMCTKPECQKANLTVPEGKTLEEYLDFGTLTVSMSDWNVLFGDEEDV